MATKKQVDEAMQYAHYEQMEDGRWFGNFEGVPELKGLWADGDTEQDARRELRDVVTDLLDTWLAKGQQKAPGMCVSHTGRKGDG
jgi:predicted RNase H-like HicB family nuclease